MSRIRNVLLALSLLIGTGVNLWGGMRFIFFPEVEANSLGLPISGSSASGDAVPVEIFHNMEVLLHLTGVLLFVLAVFYLMLAIKVFRNLRNPANTENYAEGIAFAVFARLCGVAFYIWILVRDGRPHEFKLYLFINLALAVSHALFLGRAGWGSLLRSQNQQATTGER